MFESENEKETERVRSRAILWFGAAAAILLAALILIFIRSKPENKPVLENVTRAGAAAFDSYKDKVEIEVIDKITHPNMVGLFQLEVKARFYNRGDKTLTGIEVLGKMLDMEDKVIAQNTSIPIPRIRTQPLKPGESFAFSVKVDSPAKITEAEVKDIIVELKGLQFE